MNEAVAIPVFTDKYARGWPEHVDVEPKHLAVYKPISRALTEPHSTDAHLACYSVPEIDRRLAGSAIFAELAGVPMVMFLVDVEPDGHAAVTPEWWAGERTKIDILIADHPGGFVYRTRGGYRIVYKLAQPVVLGSAADAARWKARYLAWLDHVHTRYAIVGDRACQDWTRLYRLPRVVRDGQQQEPETIGDANQIGIWDVEVTIPEPAAPEPRRPNGSYTPKAGDFNIREFMATHYPGSKQRSTLEAECWDIECPWKHEHTTDSGPRETTVFEYPNGKWEFHCMHNHCADRKHDAFRQWHQPEWRPFDPNREPRRAQGTRPPPSGNAPGSDPKPAHDTVDDDDTDAIRLTDVGNGQRIARMFGHELRYVNTWKSWLHWDGARWKHDEVGIEVIKAKAMARKLFADAARLAANAADIAADSAANADGRSERLTELADTLVKWARSSSKATALRAAALLAQTEDPITATADAFDRDPWTLNVLNGTLDLRTGKLRPHRREDMITMLAPVMFNANAKAPVWEAFLQRVVPDQDVREYLQRFAGCMLTGDVGDEVVTFLYGTGANGKSKFVGALQSVLGDYAMQGSPGLLLAADKGNGEELARRQRAGLRGKRLVAVQELEVGRYLNEAQIKQLSGGDKITAARLYENEFEFEPTHKLIVATNYKPKVKGQDDGIWRRLRLVPFTVTIPPEERDPDLAAKLQAEAAGILAWCVRGCTAWQRDGLAAPAAICAATDGYRDNEDRLAEFLESRTERNSNAYATVADLYSTYTSWCASHDEEPWSKKALSCALEERGFGLGRRSVRTIRSRCVFGLRILGQDSFQ